MMAEELTALITSSTFVFPIQTVGTTFQSIINEMADFRLLKEIYYAIERYVIEKMNFVY